MPSVAKIQMCHNQRALAALLLWCHTGSGENTSVMFSFIYSVIHRRWKACFDWLKHFYSIIHRPWLMSGWNRERLHCCTWCHTALGQHILLNVPITEQVRAVTRRLKQYFCCALFSPAKYGVFFHHVFQFDQVETQTWDVNKLSRLQAGKTLILMSSSGNPKAAITCQKWFTAAAIKTTSPPF